MTQKKISEPPSRGMRLLKKGQSGLMRALFSRLGIMLLLVLIQIAVPVLLLWRFEEYASWIYTVSLLFSLVMVIILLNCRTDPTAKITWLLLFAVFPLLGAFWFWYSRADLGNRALKKRLDRVQKLSMDKLTGDEIEKAPHVAALSHYLMRGGCYPAYHAGETVYFPSGEAKFEALLEELKKAEHFIFLEYFIIEEGIMWGKILEILARKAAEGVEVRLLYDGTCEFTTLNHRYPKKLAALGIKCKMFSPLTPFFSTYYNYRDHRKIVVIDGKVAFTGGVNLADEYINLRVRYGHWKDAALMVKGRAVESFTLMFLTMWNLTEKKPSFDEFLPPKTSAPADTVEGGYVIPYADSPLDGEKAGETVYMDLLNRAQKSVMIMTPYLILDGEMETALKFCAERGVKVTLILPGIPDKKLPYALAVTHFRSLLDAGVQLFSYTPGFVHAKVFLCDDREGVVGTINLDYRSLYHHFECAAYLCDTPCLASIREDFENTLTQCREITLSNYKKHHPVLRFIGVLLKWLAPLL